MSINRRDACTHPSRRDFLRGSLGAAALAASACSGAPSIGRGGPSGRPPNVVFFLIDDLGWTDLGCYGSKVYQTPATDRLATEGVRFTQAYACHPMCVSSRWALMTGKYPARGGVPGRAPRFAELQLSEFTIAEALKAQGYATFFAGKWHIGDKGLYPEDQGFDINKGGHKWGMPVTYYHPYRKGDAPRNVPGLPGGEPDEYLTDRLTEETVTFIKDNRDRPFFAYLSHYAVHTPVEGKPDLVEKYRDVIAQADFQGPAWETEGASDRKMHHDNPDYAAMVQSVDESVARITAVLDELNLTDDTLIVFTSDNGGDSCKTLKRGYSTSTAPLRGGKCWLYEGGVRVPCIVKGPGVDRPGTVSDALVTGVDHYATILEMLGLPTRPEQHLDAVSYAPILRGEKRPPREPMFWHFPNASAFDWVINMGDASAVRDGRYKLIQFYPSRRCELYDLGVDIEEKNDLSTRMPGKTAELRRMLDRWRQAVGAPIPRSERN